MLYFASTVCRWFIGMSCLVSHRELSLWETFPWCGIPSLFLRKPRQYPLSDDFIVPIPHGVLCKIVTDHDRETHSPKLSAGPWLILHQRPSRHYIHHHTDLLTSHVCMVPRHCRGKGNLLFFWNIHVEQCGMWLSQSPSEKLNYLPLLSPLWGTDANKSIKSFPRDSHRDYVNEGKVIE